MNEEERKAVEILNTFELRRKTKNYKEISLEDSQSVEILLNLLGKLLKENKYMHNELDKQQTKINKYAKENEKLKAVRKWYFENTVSKICTPEMLNKILRNDYISKQKVKDKIEKIKQEKKKYGNCLIKMYEDELVNRDIKILQELIEEREKN